MRIPYVVVAALVPAAVLAAPVRMQAEIPGFTRGAPLPKWTLPLAEIPRTERTDPVVMRLSETQSWVGAVPATTINRAIQVNDADALGNIGQYAISYFALYQKLTLHRVMILRGDQRLDRTASVSIRPLQRETNIESGMLGGATTLQLLLDDVRIGDTLWITYTTEGENPVFGKRWADDFHWDGGTPIELRRVTVLHPKNRPLYWRQLGDFQQEKIVPRIEQVGDIERMHFEGRALEAVEPEPSVPSDYVPVRLVQMSEYQDWREVATWADGLFPGVAPTPALKTLARQFGAEKTALAQAGAALHWVQNEIRYFSVSIGENSHRPQAPDVVLQRRYGDCKDKSYLLVSLLRELGIRARPLLLSADAPRLAAKVLPSPSWFNHVIVQVSIDGRDYYVDPTRINQPEPLTSMPTAFPGAAVLLVDPATRELSTLPERSDTFPTYEHSENVVLTDFSGAATLETRDVYRSTYADGMRSYFPRMSVNEQKKSVLASYEKQYAGITLDGAPVYRDDVAENRIEVISHYKLPKALTLKDTRYQMEFDSKVIAGTLGIPAKLVRNFPFELAGGRFIGRYRLHIQWPKQVRQSQPPLAKTLDNPYFQAHEELTFRGNDSDYQMDYRLKQRTLPASELPALQEQAKLLNEFVEGSMQIDKAALLPDELQSYSLRDLKSLRAANRVLDAMAALQAKPDRDIALAEACAYVDAAQGLTEFVGNDAMQLAGRLARLVAASAPQPGLAACKAQLALASGRYADAIAALSGNAAPADDDALTRELAWAMLHTGDTDGALATMARYRAARERGSAGVPDVVDAASEIALLQRAGRPLPPALQAYARAAPDGPWPRPVLAMQLGLISAEELLRQAGALRADARAIALDEAWFYIGQRRLAAHDSAGADAAFRWLAAYGLRNTSLTSHARGELKAYTDSDAHLSAGMRAAVSKDYAAAIAEWRAGDAAGSAGSRYGLGLAALNGEGLPQSRQEALRWFRLAAEQGFPEAQSMLGGMLAYGMGTERDVPQGLEWVRKAAAQDVANAQYELGSRYRWGNGVPQDYALAAQWLRAAAEQGHGNAMASLALMERNGEGRPRNYQQAEFWNRRALAHESLMAVYNLALAYQGGEGMPRDDAKAAALYRIAADQGHADAAVNLGLMYERGIGVTQDMAEAVAWYRKAADKDNPYGLRNLGNMYRFGRGVARDPVAGVAYLHKAIDQGSTAAMVSLGACYQHGEGVKQDLTQAIDWFEEAARQHNALASFELAALYEQGKQVPASPEQALRWYRQSATDGDRDAQLWLANALFEGKSMPVDVPAAIGWYDKAASQDLLAAQEQLGKIYFNGLGVTADPAKAVGYFRLAAAQGSNNGYGGLGFAYEKGWGLQADPAQAIAWYEKGARKGSAYAQVRLGKLYFSAPPPYRDEARGRHWLEQAEQRNTPAGYTGVAAAYESVADNVGAERAYRHALALAERSPGAEQTELRRCLQDLSDFYVRSQQPGKAEPLIQRNLALVQQAPAHAH